MIVAALTFHPNQKNPARASGRGVWRVKQMFLQPQPGSVLDRCEALAPRRPFSFDHLLYVPTDRAYKPGSRVDPKALALRGLKAAH